MPLLRRVLAVAVVLLLALPMATFAGRLPEPEELDKLIGKITERQSRDLKTFQKKTRAYFFDTQKPETIEMLTRDFPPGEAVTIIVFSDLTKKTVQEIIGLRKAGKEWPVIAGQLGVPLKTAIKEVKNFRLGIG